jgi:hypothetical protein
MARPLARSSFLLLALGFWILRYLASLAEGDDPNALNQQENQLIEQGHGPFIMSSQGKP